ncbi:hypothetical protein [Streptomyces yaizuensis]|uniref:Uncharacterized protein n=1 Tax=Streptomyces yaizuensis TaxID=2989713 RepID=A0ABQ5P532_9ACTN|nr:hypothetical protein [Streptomyces sp. YSPA8]GLF97698.1 hypothetical protein SYYSPA8_25395 [Streptomyces sp. YSPA8]
MNESNPYKNEGEPEYQWGPAQPYGYPPEGGPGYGYPQAQPFAYPPTQPAGVPVPAPGYGPAPVAGAGPVLVIGDITVVGDQIHTPSGSMPLKGAVWNAMDLTRMEEKIPTYAIVLAVVFTLACLVGLFFLLIKEKSLSGYVQVSVSSGGRHHTTMIPATNPMVFQQIMGQINHARMLSA